MTCLFRLFSPQEQQQKPNRKQDAAKRAVPAWSEAQEQVKMSLGDGFVKQLARATKRVGKRS